MDICFITPEAFPFAKTGGLADVAGALPKALAEIGQKCTIFLPLYQGIKARSINLSFDLELGAYRETAQVYQVQNLINTYFIRNDSLFNRKGLYGTERGDYPDNLERFTFFTKATLEVMKRLALKFDIIHLHDWQAALVAAYLRAHPNNFYNKTVFTIHNLGYQGIFPKEKFRLLNLPQEYYSINGIEYYDKINLLKGGLIYSDFLTTVSPTYAQEIQTSEFGFGLDGILKERCNNLKGILNGIDTGIWNPKNDKLIYYNYLQPRDKKINKIQLKTELKLDESNKPLIGLVSRLADQKGIDLFCDAFKTIIAQGFQIAILGIGEEKYHKLLQAMAKHYPADVSLNLRFDEQLAHRIYSGADFFLMPSRYEPCGLGQMIALTYATVPVVRKTGGLADSVFEFNPNTNEGNGFIFEEYKA